jgi:hypothetical protein
MHRRTPEEIAIGNERKRQRHNRSIERSNPVRVFINEKPKLSLVDNEEGDSVKALKSSREAIGNKMKAFEMEDKIDLRHRELIERTLGRYEERDAKKSKNDWDSPARRTPPGERQTSAIRRDQERKAA